MTPVAKTSKKKVTAVTWAEAPAEHDYPSAEAFLRLIAEPAQVQACLIRLAEAPTIHQAAKDILRASRLPLLPATDPEVAKDLRKVSLETPLSPILLVRGDIAEGRPLQIADGYHRVCASYQLGENTAIPCRLITLPEAAPARPESGHTP